MTSAGPRRVLARATSILPRGSGVVGGWVLFTGLASYGFLTITGRALGPERYGGLSALWALGFLLGNGACLPIEQEVSRALASRAARGVGGAPAHPAGDDRDARLRGGPRHRVPARRAVAGQRTCSTTRRCCSSG